jgi:endonuclease/exonuclease/phosphatase (EEP) superfamily protein YafD
MDPATRTGWSEVRRGVSGAVALVLTAVALPSLAARWLGGRPPGPGPALAALAPLAAVPAVVAVIVAVTTRWWLAVVLALPAAVLAAWQLPPPRRAGPPATGPIRAAPGPGQGALAVTLRVFTLNVEGGRADPVAVLHSLRRHRVDVLAVQELTPAAAGDLDAAGLADLLPFSHLDPHPGSTGAGLWARWPLAPLPRVPGMWAATLRARIDPAGGPAVTVTAVHPIAPVRGNERQWRQELGQIRSALAGTGGPQVAAGDFNASRDHRPFRDLLATGFADCADAARRRPWPGFTWPVRPGIPAVMRLDHVLVSRPGASVPEARVIRVPGTDHRGVVAVIEFRPASRTGPS